MPAVAVDPSGRDRDRNTAARQDDFFPEQLEPGQSIDRALWAATMNAHSSGKSTPRMDDPVNTPGYHLEPKCFGA